jgi:enamine deaminase RidA (YjgF/YER057c/UK114 family)
MFFRSLAVVLLVGVSLRAGEVAGPIRTIRSDDRAATSAAVVVAATAHLAHTEQIFPVGADGKVIGAGRVDDQVATVLDRLESTLKQADSGLDQLVKIDVYLARADALASFQKVFGARMAGHGRPAVTYVVGALPRPEAVIALDAIGVTSSANKKPGRRLAVLPAGPRVFVSGQAEPGDDLADAARKTLRGLDSTLKFLGVDWSRVVRLKAFMQPMTPASAAAVEREVSAVYSGKDVPPLSLVEWRLSPKLPVEIELVVAGREFIEAPIAYLSPPGLKPSPVFSRVASLGAGPLIYISGIYGAAGASGTDQVEAIFATLAGILTQAGSDFRHLAKATYFVIDNDASNSLNELRIHHFEPSRPPAASKAFAAGMALEDRTVMLDMIAVPTRE